MTSLALKAARRAGIEERELTPYGRVGGAGEGRAKSWTGNVALFELGGEKIVNNRLRIDDVDGTDQGVIVGLDYFLSHRIYVSRLQHQVYITWNGGPVFAQGTARRATTTPAMRRCRRTSARTTPTRSRAAALPPPPRGTTRARWKT